MSISIFEAICLVRNITKALNLSRVEWDRAKDHDSLHTPIAPINDKM